MMFGSVLIDYGHGGVVAGVYQTVGKKQYHFTDQARRLSIYEGVVNRRIAAKLATLLIHHGTRVFDVVGNLVLEGECIAPELLCQDDVPLARRVQRANAQRSDAVLVSIHSNAMGDVIEGPSQPARGFGVFTSPGQTAADPVAETIADAMELMSLRVRREVAPDGDADIERDFFVLRRTAMPAVLTENGFFTNVSDARFLLSDRGTAAIAEAHMAGLKPHLES